MPASDTASDGPAADPRSYEQARDELVEIVRRLEQGGLSLAESLALWERGEALADACQGWLDGARARLDAVLAGDTQPDADAELEDEELDSEDDEDDEDSGED